MIEGFVVSVISLLVLAAPPQKVTFPGQRAEVAGPGGRFSIVWVAADENPSGEHQLLLKELRSGSARLLLRFGRSVEIAWAPDGRRVAVTDRVGSDSAETWVHSVDGAPPVSVWTTLEHQQGKGSLAFTSGAHHMYVEANRWLNNSTLLVRVWGYGGAEPFDRRMRVKVRE